MSERYWEGVSDYGDSWLELVSYETKVDKIGRKRTYRHVHKTMSVEDAAAALNAAGLLERAEAALEQILESSPHWMAPEAVEDMAHRMQDIARQALSDLRAAREGGQ